jgi:hypothetical protein
MNTLKYIGSRKMAETKIWDTQALIRCDNKKYRQLLTEYELKRNQNKCPYCGKTISKPE